MALIFYIILILLGSGISVNSQLLKILDIKLPEDAKLTFPELAVKYGHPATTHYVTTEDGYILTLYHQRGDTKRPVLLIHGNTPTSDCWILRGNSSMAITLAELGYDVWSINLRGTRYSRKHVKLNPDRDYVKFFNYSFYEEAYYDVPATIDYVLKETKQKQLTAIAHSVGTTLLYVMGSERPEYNEKIKVAISLAPIAFLDHVRGYAGLILPILTDITKIFSFLKIEEVFTHDGLGALLRFFCKGPLGYGLCIEGVLFPALGRDREGFEPEFMTTFFGHYPGGTTRKIFEHLGQVAKTHKFAKFDYGRSKNIEEYGSSEPPNFDLGKVTMKTAIFVGEEDLLATVKDSERLNRSLGNVVHYQVLPYEKFNHFDFVWGAKMSENLYPYVFEVLKKYT